MATKYKKRADGRYLVQVLTGYKPNGKPVYKNVYAKTIRELEEKTAKVRDEIEKGIFIQDESFTVGGWALRWLELYKSTVMYNTKRMYEAAVNSHIIPKLGTIKLKDLKPHHVQDMLNALIYDKKGRMAEVVSLTLKQMLDQAIKNGYANKNVAAAAMLPAKTKTKKRALTDDEQLYVRNAKLPLREKLFVILLLTTGARRGEALALQVADIDLEKRTININKTVIGQSNKLVMSDRPKSEAGNRSVPITDELYNYLTDYLSSHKHKNLFMTTQGKPMTGIAFRNMWTKILNAMNIAAGGTIGKNRIEKLADDITPHIFRHTYATLLYRAGVDVKTAQYLLGHKTLQMTLEIYTHLDSTKQKQEVDKFNMFMENMIQSKISQISQNE